MQERQSAPVTLAAALFRALPLAALIHGPMTIIDANTAACEVFEADSADDLCGLLIHDIVHPDGHQAGDERRALIFSRAQRFACVPVKLMSLKGRCVRSSGAAVPFKVGPNPLALAVSTPSELPVSLVRDALPPLERFSVDTDVREAALHVLPLPVLAHDSVSIVYANPAACACLRAAKPADLIGRPVAALLEDEVPNDAGGKSIGMRTLDGTTVRMDGRTQTLHRDGTRITLWVATVVTA